MTANLRRRLRRAQASLSLLLGRANGERLLTGAAPRMYTTDDRTESVEIGSAEWREWMIAHGEDVPPAEYPASDSSYH